MGIVLQQSHYNLEAMLQDGWTSNYKECCTNITALPAGLIEVAKLEIKYGVDNGVVELTVTNPQTRQNLITRNTVARSVHIPSCGHRFLREAALPC